MSFKQIQMSVNAYNEMRAKRFKEATGKSKKKPATMSEDTLQKMVARFLETKYPDILWFHSPNGGKRNAAEGAKFKAMGVKPGVPDILILERRGLSVGLAIELKVGNNKQTESQIKWMNDLKARDWIHCLCYDYEHATECIDAYLK